MIDYAALAKAGGLSKGTPQKVAKAKRKAVRVSIDEAESKKVRRRSMGWCEVLFVGVRCRYRASQVHHHKGGIGVRGRGESALAKNKSHVCNQCHSDIGAKTLQHIDGQKYRRVT